MTMTINTNMESLIAQNNLTTSQASLATSMQRLSSGLRINSVKDDPTGLATATTYDTQVRGTNIAIRNANDAVSKAQTLDGYAAQIIENLQRLHDIFVQTGDVATTESGKLITENARIAALTTAGLPGTVTVDGTGGTVVGVSAAVTAPAATTAAGVLNDITAVTASRSNYGADIATFSSAVATMQVASVNLSASYSRIMDTDYAAETTAMTRNNILQQAGTAVLAQANQTPNTVLTLLR